MYMCKGSKYEKERPSGKEWNYGFLLISIKKIKAIISLLHFRRKI
jgi:hypothetical protein